MFSSVTNIVKSLAALRMLLGLIDPIRELVRQVETPGITGALKKDAVLNLIQTGVNAAESAFSIDLPNGLIMKFAGAIIDVIVSVENAIGTFTHDRTPEATPEV